MLSPAAQLRLCYEQKSAIDQAMPSRAKRNGRYAREPTPVKGTPSSCSLLPVATHVRSDNVQEVTCNLHINKAGRSPRLIYRSAELATREDLD
jgi:hypothetical protein